MDNVFTNWAETAVLDHILGGPTGYTWSANVFVGLHTADPTDAGGNETSYSGYTRATISFNAAANRAVIQNGNCTFGTCTAGSTNITHYGIYDSFTTGNLICYGSLSAVKSITTDNVPSIQSGYIVATLSANYMSDYQANAILDHVFATTSFSQPTNLFAAVATVNASDSSTGSAFQSLGVNYTRVTLSGSPLFTITNNTATNSSAIVFPAAGTGGWGTITAIGILDSFTSGAGNLIYYDNGITEQDVSIGDTVQVNAGAITITLD